MLEFLKEFNVWTALIRITAAAILGGLIGFERGRHGRAAGMRTHIFVCLGASVCAVIGLYTAEVLGHANDPLRVGAQVVSGIGFLGAGTILIKGRSHITGLTTAAGLWTTAAIGLAIGVGFYEVALLCTIICIFTATFLSLLESEKKEKKHTCALYLEVIDARNVNAVMDYAECLGLFHLHIGPPKSEIQGNVGIDALWGFTNEEEIHSIIEKLIQHENVAYVCRTNREF